MGIVIELPAALQPYAAGRAEVALEERCATVGAALDALARRHAGVTDRVRDEQGRVRRHVNVFVDGEEIRYLAGLATPLAEGSVLVIVPAVSGG